MGKLHNWKLFIDDVRMPHARDYIIARNSYDAIWMLESYGFPITIAFDHDLGGKDTAMTVVNWLWKVVIDEGFKLPDDFTFTVHSANPVGAQNIRNRMNDIVKYSHEQLDTDLSPTAANTRQTLQTAGSTPNSDYSRYSLFRED